MAGDEASPDPQPGLPALPTLPALLRAARRTYGGATRDALWEAGFDDVPVNGPFVLAALVRTDAPLSRVIEELGSSKQAAGHLVDTLVTRGYLERSVDPADRRRLTVTLTPRGRAAASLITEEVERIDTELVGLVGEENIARTRTTLAALAQLGVEEHLR
jgi:DNA-binding MarR family transcriptional regulator